MNDPLALVILWCAGIAVLYILLLWLVCEYGDGVLRALLYSPEELAEYEAYVAIEKADKDVAKKLRAAGKEIRREH